MNDDPQTALDLQPPPRPWMPDASNATIGAPAARHDNPDTSKRAAEQMHDVAEAQRYIILGALKILGPHGANAFEMDELQKFPRATSGRRFSDLAHPKSGAPLVATNGLRRPTATASYKGQVYVALDFVGQMCSCLSCAAARAFD